jgi:AcrR family transcriptional regulator
MTEPDQRSTKSRILASGAELMAEKGFSGVSVREICAHADTSMNMLHHYFGSKQGLLDAIVAKFSSGVFALPMRLLDKERGPKKTSSRGWNCWSKRRWTPTSSTAR